MQDTIYIKGLKVKTTIGILPYERLARQTLLVGLELAIDLHLPGQTDTLSDGLDYRQVVQWVEDFAACSEFQLLEAFAEALCAGLLQQFPHCQGITLDLQKPGALRQTQQLGLRIHRARD